MLTPTEIINFLSLGREFPPCDLKKIKQMVKHEFRTCLGYPFYEYLMSHLIDYECNKYQRNTTYQIGNVVVFDSTYKIATEETTALPSDIRYWENAPKFDKKCLEILWCEYLGEYLSWSALIPQLPFLVTKIKHGTVVQLHGEGFSSASKDGLARLERSSKQMRAITYSNMDAFIKENNEEGCYDLYKGITCNTKPKKRQSGWRLA